MKCSSLLAHYLPSTLVSGVLHVGVFVLVGSVPSPIHLLGKGLGTSQGQVYWIDLTEGVPGEVGDGTIASEGSENLERLGVPSESNRHPNLQSKLPPPEAPPPALDHRVGEHRAAEHRVAEHNRKSGTPDEEISRAESQSNTITDGSAIQRGGPKHLSGGNQNGLTLTNKAQSEQLPISSRTSPHHTHLSPGMADNPDESENNAAHNSVEQKSTSPNTSWPKRRAVSGADAEETARRPRSPSSEASSLHPPLFHPEGSGSIGHPGGSRFDGAATLSEGGGGDDRGGAYTEVGAGYLKAFTEWLGAHQRYPALARRRGWEGDVLTRIRLSREGSVTQAAVQQSSGHSLLDESALEMVWNATPFPPPPIQASEVDLVVPIRFQLKRSS